MILQCTNLETTACATVFLPIWFPAGEVVYFQKRTELVALREEEVFWRGVPEKLAGFGVHKIEIHDRSNFCRRGVI